MFPLETIGGQGRYTWVQTSDKQQIYVFYYKIILKQLEKIINKVIKLCCLEQSSFFAEPAAVPSIIFAIFNAAGFMSFFYQ